MPRRDSEEMRRSLKREALAGVTTFLTMSYIVIVNPAILATEGTGMPFPGVVTATVLTAAVFTLLMGLYARLPFAVAPGMGLNAFFTYSIILGEGVPWTIALGMVFWAGIFFLLISVTPLREAIARAVPPTLRLAAAAGIGLFLTFIGLRNAGLVEANPVTLVQPGTLDVETLLAIIGLLVTALLVRRKNPLAFLVGITLVTALAALSGRIEIPSSLLSSPDFSSVFLRLDPLGALQWSLLPAMLSLLFTDLFDSLSTFLGVAHANRLTDDEGQPLHLRQGLIVDALATLGAGLMGSSPGTAYIESSAGINSGGRTGWTSIVTAACFLPCLFLAPLVGAVPSFATAPVLILVGLFMFRSVTELPMERIEEALPAFLIILLIPLTFSITEGILWGFASYLILHLITGRISALHKEMIGLGVASIIMLWLF